MIPLHPKHVPFEYPRITPQIYIGTNQCCEGHFASELLQKGIKGDLSAKNGHGRAPTIIASVKEFEKTYEPR